MLRSATLQTDIEMLYQTIGAKYFKLYANCIPVKGASRSIICDIQRIRYHFITNDLFDILLNKASWQLKDIFDL